MKKGLKNSVQKDYVNKIVAEFIKTIKERYFNLMLNKNYIKNEKQMSEQDILKFKKFESQLDGFGSFLEESFSWQIKTKNNLHYSSDYNYEGEEREFGFLIENGAIDYFGKEISQLLGENFFIEIYANKENAVLNITKIKDGKIVTKSQKICNNLLVEENKEM